MPNLVIVDAAEIVTPISFAKPQRGKEMREVRIWKNACLSANPNTGKILEIGSWRKVGSPKATVIEAKNHVVFPGFVDSHTHPVFGGSRVDEFLLRRRGQKYMGILSRGGGILSTVKSTCRASDKDLKKRVKALFRRILHHGTTTLEAKSGYGLSTKEELRHLRILREAKKSSSLEIFTTFLGAHAIPPSFKSDPQRYVDLVCEEMLPQAAKFKLADFCDVFCEPKVFTVSQTRKILSKAKELGMDLRLHADEFESIGGTEIGVSLGALSVDHLMQVSTDGIRTLAKSNTVATLLPCTTFFVGEEKFAPARTLIDQGAIVALATDFNAGSNHCFSMQMAASLGLLQMAMTPEEVLVAATLHGACALGVSDRIGSLHPGKQADLIMLEGDDYRETFYRFGTNQVTHVVKKARVVTDN